MLSVNDLGKLIQQYTQLGHVQAVKMYDPVSDVIRISEVERWLKHNNIDCGLFRKLVKLGVIEKHRTGLSKNSPVAYSKAEILAAINTKTMCQWLADGEISW